MLRILTWGLPTMLNFSPKFKDKIGSYSNLERDYSNGNGAICSQLNLVRTMMPDLSLSHFNGICIAHARRWSTVSVPGWILIQKNGDGFLLRLDNIVGDAGRKKEGTNAVSWWQSFVPSHVQQQQHEPVLCSWLRDENLLSCFIINRHRLRWMISHEMYKPGKILLALNWPDSTRVRMYNSSCLNTLRIGDAVLMRRWKWSG